MFAEEGVCRIEWLPIALVSFNERGGGGVLMPKVQGLDLRVHDKAL
jgi:hypothetical protein